MGSKKSKTFLRKKRLQQKVTEKGEEEGREKRGKRGNKG